MKIGKCRVLIGSMVLAFSGSIYAGSCDRYMAEAEAVEGVVPKLNDDGSIRAFVMYGEDSFIAPKRSLITKARRKAELRAKRAFSEWMEQNLESESAYADMMETVEQTDSSGMTAGTATEVSQSIDIMRTNSQAVLSGIIKLDECLDTDQRVIFVEMGWKPSLSAAAADTKSKINSEVARGNSNGSGSGSNQGPAKSAVTPQNDYRKKSSLKDAF